MESGRHSRHRQIDLFNFSFLDILACVIGLLIFILTLVVVSGGRTSSGPIAGSLADAEHGVEAAKQAARIAAERRARAEALLGQRAQDLADPQAVADSLRRQIRMFDEERDTLAAATVDAERRSRSANEELRAIESQPSDPEAAALQSQLRDLDQKIAELTQKAADAAAKAKAQGERVSYYVPHVKSTSRFPVFVEIVGDRMWCVHSDAYQAIRISDDSTRYVRIAGAPGVSVNALVDGKVAAPPDLTVREPDGVVIHFLVRQNGYSSFRRLREWAWSKGFAVYWVPMEPAEEIVLTRTTSSVQQ
jgi:hypothetical protein